MDYIVRGEDGSPTPYVTEGAVGEALKHLPEANHLLTRLRGMSMVHIDLLHAESLFRRLAQVVSAPEVDRDIAEALWWAGSLKYARCFNSSTARKTSLNKKRFSSSLPDAAQATHLFICHARDNHIAHASSPEHEKATFLFLLGPDHLKPTARKVQSMAPNAALAIRAAELCRTAATEAHAQALAVGEKLFEMMLTIPFQVWRGLAICPSDSPGESLIGMTTCTTGDGP